MADVITRLKIDSKEYDDKIKRAAQGLTNLEQSLRNTGKSFTDVDKSVVDYVRQLGSMQTASTTAKGKIGEMGNAFTELSLVYKRMTEQEKASPVGQAMAQSLEQLRGRTIEAKNELAQLNKQLTDNSTVTEAAAGDNMNFDSVLQSLGSQFGINGNLMGVLTAGTAGYTAAITASVAATVAATKAWADYNAEMEKRANVVTVTTELKGDDAAKLQDGISALAEVYDVDFREAVNAANTLMTQFGVNGSEALSLLQDGMQGMIQGDGGKLLNMIQQFAPSFRDAGIEASQLVAIIQNSEGGLFTDQNMNAIAMGIRNIRHQTKATQEALAELGIDGQAMMKKLDDGTMTVFEALQKVAGAIDNVGSGSDAAGAIMQNVFGRSGFMAGTKLGEAIATLNTNLEETKMQTGLVGESMANLARQNEKLNAAMRDTFGYDGWKSMANGIESALVGALAEALTVTNDLRSSLFELSGIDVFSNIISGAANALGPLGSMLDYLRKIAGIGQMMKDMGGVSNPDGSYAGGGGVAGVIAKKMLPEVVVSPSDNNNNNTTTTTSSTATSSTTTPKEKWAPINMKSVDMSKWGILPADAQKQMDDVIAKVEELEGVTIDPITMEVTVDDASVLEELKKIDGVKLDEKSMKLTVDDAKLNQTLESVKTSTVNFLFGRSVNDVNADMSKATRSYNEAGDEIGRAAAKVLVEKFKGELEGMKNEGDLTKGEMKDAYTRDFRKELKGTEYDLANVTTGTERVVKKRNAMSTAQTALSGVSQITGGLQQMGVKLPDELHKVVSGMQGLMSVIQGVQSIMSLVQIPQTVAQIASENANTAAMLGLTAAVVANTSAVSVNSAFSLIPFATGGIVHAADGYAVPGNWGYDAVPSMLTSGELVLNRAQQGNLASQLEGARSAQASGASTPYLRGEDIYLGVNNFLRRSGRGEIVTSKR